MVMTKGYEPKVTTCLNAFEGVNPQLVFTLKQCARLLKYVPPPFDHEQEILQDIEKIIDLNERLVQKKTEFLHQSVRLMAEKLSDKELVSFKEMIIANSVQVDALAQLIIKKQLITKNDFCAKLKAVQIRYECKAKEKVV
jgi:hypothetical protein